jgi:proline iminopeptidase
MIPDAHTIKEFYISVGDGHQLYVYEWGNPKGLPIFFFHGGPGAEVKDKHKEPFDPAKHHVIFFDQRGCGKSLPLGSILHNTTDDILQDASKIADHLKLKEFVVHGRSWGSTLALAYALKYPKRVTALVIAAIFTASARELHWLDHGGFNTHFPEVWEKYLERTPKAHRQNPSAYHYKTILGNNEKLARSSALAMDELERNVMSLDDRPQTIDETTYDIAGRKIFAHYATNNFFMPERHILDNAHKLNMPVWMVHGRYDMDCPPITAYELHKKLPRGQLLWAISNHRAEHETNSILRTILLQLAEKP